MEKGIQFFLKVDPLSSSSTTNVQLFLIRCVSLEKKIFKLKYYTHTYTIFTKLGRLRGIPKNITHVRPKKLI
jgi:hypothetical protein